MAGPTKSNAQEHARRALALLFEPDDVVELRAFDCKEPRGTWTSTWAGYFDDMDRLAQEAMRLSGRAPGVYVTLNPVNPDLLARRANRVEGRAGKGDLTTDGYVPRRRNLLIDCDAVRPPGISSTANEHDAALKRIGEIRETLAAEGWPEPMVNDSGNGGHLIYRVDLPADDGKLVQRALQALALRFDDPTGDGPRVTIDGTVYNPARIVKLPGTLVCKGDNTPERPHRYARILSAPEALEVVPTELIERLAGEVEPEPGPERQSGGAVRRQGERTLDLERWVKDHIPDAVGPTAPGAGGTLWELPECPWRDGDGATAFVGQLPGGALYAGCQHATCPGSKSTGNHWRELREMMDPGCYDGIRGNGNGAAPEAALADAQDDYHQSDLGNARRFVVMHQHHARFDCSSGLWLIWSGQRWKEDPDGEAVRMAKETVRAMFAELATIDDKEDRKKFFRFVIASESLTRITAMLKLAQTEPEIALTRDKLDADPWLFNVRNGTLDLRTGELLPHNKDHLITRLAPVEYDPSASLPMWDDFLMDSTGNDEEMIRFLARTVGYSLTGDCREEKLFFVHGPTNSGKSTFLEAIKSVMGDYATTADFETFLSRSFVGGPRPDIARLAGSRFVASIEVDEGKKLAEGLVKQITGGDTVTARFLYKSEFEFLPQFKLWLAANHAPEIKHDDAAMWRRILKLPFEISVPEEKRNPAVKETLKDVGKSGAAILAWAMRGCLDWQEQGLAVPDRVTDATAQYRRDQDPLREFVLSSCVLSENVKAPASALRTEYESWCREAGEKPIYGAAWGKALRSRGCRQDRQRLNGVLMRVWSGIGLITGGEDDDDPLPF